MSPKTKKYVLGVNRFLIVKKINDDYCITITDTKTHKTAEFSAVRWPSFTRYIDVIDENVKELRERKNVDYLNHIGGGWYVSITTGIWCIDIRKFYEQHGQLQPKPTRIGIALRLHEWATFKDAVTKLHTDFPELAAMIPCYLNLDHAIVENVLQCPECSPFPTILSSFAV
jgi:hypothetical protein